MKKCIKCGFSKDESEFNRNKSRKDGLQTACRECSKIVLRKHYNNNADSYRRKNKKRSYDIVKYLLSYLETHHCVDCGESDKACLDFDHRDDVDKKFNLAEASANRYSFDTIQKEIDKCDVRCANCHRKRTARKQGWYGDLV